MNQTKICTKCNLEKSLTQFNKQSSQHDGLAHQCRECAKEWHKQHYQKNKDTISISASKWSRENPEICKEAARLNYQLNKEIKTAQKKQWAIDNPEKMRQYKINYKKTVQGKATGKSSQHVRRVRLKGIKGSYNGQEIINLFKSQKGRCVYCDTKLNLTEKHGYHIDHIWPLAHPKCTNDIKGIQLLCPACNCKKSDKSPEAFAQNHGMLF